MRKIRTIFLISILFAMFFSTSINLVPAKPQARPVIKIGGLGPLSITPGKDMRKGIELAVKEINDGDGVDVDGTVYDFEVFIEDNSGTTGLPDTDKALTALSKLTVDEEVVAIVGGFRTEVMWGIQANLGTTGTPFLGVGSTAQLISEYYWRVGPSNGSLLAFGLIDLYGFGLLNKGVDKVTIIREDVAWTPPLSKLVQFYLGYYLAAMNVTAKAVEFTSDITVTQEAGLDAVGASLANVGDDVDALMPIFSAPVGKYVTQAWFNENMSQMLAGINVEAQSSTYFDETEGGAYGEITMHPNPPDLTPTTKTAGYKTGYDDKWGEDPTYTATFSYDAVYILKEAIERADSFAKADIQTALASTDMVGAAWQYKFTSEPGPQLILADFLPNGTKVVAPVPGTEGTPYGTITVHDLYTKSTVGFRNKPFPTTYFTQWQQNGTVKTVWGATAAITDDAVAFATGQSALEWPINHAEHGYSPKQAPGFELPLILLVLSGIAAIVRTRKRRKF
ncbi:MAG: ABC transporter substrate-binding protein [Candidatus Hodarchaeales archaeon]|jgi:branched-chain amino acid transport system substrate-binding protein